MTTKAPARSLRPSYLQRLWKNIKQHRGVYLMLIPVLIYYIIFNYAPMYGAQIAFRNFRSTRQGITGAPWVGLKNFETFFNGVYATRLIRNTLLLNVLNLIFGFPAPIILALLLNELRNQRFKKVVQTISYLPHFISMVVICGMIKDFLATDGVITTMISAIVGHDLPNLLTNKDYYRAIYVISDIWQGVGWGAIIYIAALAGIDQQLYEAASIDGAGKWRQMLNVTLPGILPTIMIMLILRIGNMMSLGYEKTLLLYNEGIYETSDIISTYVYRAGLLGNQKGLASAVDLMNSFVNLILLFSANFVSRKFSGSSLW